MYIVLPSMDPGPPDNKRPRLSNPPSTGSSSPWSAGPQHRGVSILHSSHSPTTGQPPPHQHPQPPPPPPPPPQQQYQQQPSPHPYNRPPPPGPPGPPGPPDAHPPPPASHPPPPGPHQQAPFDDPRHHEPERIPPMHELRQPPQSPAHPPYQGYPPRGDPMVKPEGGDEGFPQMRRPQSTGNAPDSMTPGTPHSAHPPPPYADDKRHMSFDSGPPPGMYRASYPPPTPVQHTQPYDYPAYGPPHGGEIAYAGIQYAPATAKKKAQRASQACDNCRALKAKCDEMKPCKSCKEKKIECKYRETVPKQQDKVAADILESLMFLRNEFAGFNQRIAKLERAVKRVAPSVDVQTDPMDEEEDRPLSADSVQPTAEEGYSMSPGETVTATQPPIPTQEARNIARLMEEEPEQEPGPFVRPGTPAIPLNHTTLAALLLKWRSIQSLVQRYLDVEGVKFVDEFPIRQEERRGLLRVWGRGEGLDSRRTDREAIHDVGLMEVHDDYSDAGAPSPADCWGGISGSPGPVDPKGTVVGVQTLDFSPENVWKYVKSYEANIQNMHPLIIPVELHAMVTLFLDGIQQNASKSKGSVAQFVRPASQVESAGSKRKRTGSPAAEGGLPEPIPTPTALRLTKPTFQRSINNALVLLVLALGKICLHNKKLPDVVPVSEQHTHGSPLVRNGTAAHPASPTQGSPPAYNSHHSSGLPSPKENPERTGSSRRPSFQGGNPPSMKPTSSLKRNLDVIPGLDYFAYATDILGGQLAGTSLRHIHAYILAGLYHGQLGRVMESYAYIKEAGWALQIKMRPSLDRFKRLSESLPNGLNSVGDKSDNQLVMAFWTCLQLESDIVAELPLPQSHVLAFEDMMPYPNPNVAKDSGFDDLVLQSYLAQLYLRKGLNQIHSMLYNPEDPQQPRDESTTPPEKILTHIQQYLDLSKFVPPAFQFHENDPPAKDILSARLRAKYWGSQVITYRPFIRQILESNHKAQMESPAAMSSPNGSQAPISGEYPQSTIEYARRGIKALIESTRAFHGIEQKRFIVTNVFGTAHAQWGNLLTLAAVYRDPTLRQYVDDRTLRELFQKTISFFKVIAQPSSALAIDMRILEGLEHELWRRPNNNTTGAGPELLDPNTGSSFSSTTSGPPGPPGPPPPGSIPYTHSIAAVVTQPPPGPGPVQVSGPMAPGPPPPPSIITHQMSGPQGVMMSGPGTPVEGAPQGPGPGPGPMMHHPYPSHLPPHSQPGHPQPQPQQHQHQHQHHQHPPIHHPPTPTTLPHPPLPPMQVQMHAMAPHPQPVPQPGPG